MKKRISRALMMLITGFVGLTATGGGLALSAGAEGARFPLDWLSGTPFKDYVLPGLILAIGVGGSSLAAFVLLLLKKRFAPFVAIAAGAVLIGFVSVEVMILKQVPPGPTPIEVVYLCVGMLVVVASVVNKRA